PELDDVDDLLRHALLQRLWLMRYPFELAVHLACGRQNRNLAHSAGEAGLEAQVAIDCADVRSGLRTVELHAAGPLQTGDRASRLGAAVVGGLARVIQVLAIG